MPITQHVDQPTIELTTARAQDLAKFNPYLEIFHEHDGRWIWLNTEVPSDGDIRLDANSRLHLANVNVHRITLSGGVGLGFMFTSPLRNKNYGKHLLLYREGVDVEWLIQKKRTAKREYKIQGKLLFFCLDDEVILISSYLHSRLHSLLEI